MGHFSVEKSPQTGSLLSGNQQPALVARQRDRLKDFPGALQRLEDLLVAAGYHESQASTYAEPQLKPASLKLYRVRDEFPRLRREDLHRGIVAGKYSVAVNACSDFQTELSDFAAVFAGDEDVY